MIISEINSLNRKKLILEELVLQDLKVDISIPKDDCEIDVLIANKFLSQKKSVNNLTPNSLFDYFKEKDFILDLHPFVARLLRKTCAYVNNQNEIEIVGLIECINYYVSCIIQDHSLKLILDQAIKNEGYIYLVDQIPCYNKVVYTGLFYCNSKNIHILKNRPPEYMVSTLIHESTHKVIQLLYNNRALPFNNFESPDSQYILKKLVESDLQEAKYLVAMDYIIKSVKEGAIEEKQKSFFSSVQQDSWVDQMKKYNAETHYPVELFAYFTGFLAESILQVNNPNITKVSDAYMAKVWQYFQELVIIPLKKSLNITPATADLLMINLDNITPNIKVLDDESRLKELRDKLDNILKVARKYFSQDLEKYIKNYVAETSLPTKEQLNTLIISGSDFAFDNTALSFNKDNLNAAGDILIDD